MPRISAVCGGAILLLGSTIATACGPEFPLQLLDDREGTLEATPANSFAFEAMHLLDSPQDSLKPVEPDYTWFDADLVKGERESLRFGAETAGLSDPLAGVIGAMRKAPNGNSAYELGEGLPVAMRLYAAGAVDFGHGDLAAAQSRFEAILTLGDADRRSRAVWAAFMLGRVFGAEGDLSKASTFYAETRYLSRNGGADPLGLALASFGNEARLYLDRANAAIDAAGSPYPDYEVAAADLGRAVTLYAEQAARGSRSGIDSLRIIAHGLLEPERQDSLRGQNGMLAATADPVASRLLVIYALAFLDDAPAWPARADAGKRFEPVAPNPALTSLLDDIAGHYPLEMTRGTDRLAAMAYRAGNYALAGRLADAAPGPLGSWVKAKLALQAGDLAEAQRFYAAASLAFPPAIRDASLDEDNRRLVVGESGVLALARGEYVDALDKLYPVASTYWGDVAYIAERVLTATELKAFVDAKVPAPAALAHSASEDEWGWRFAKAPGIELRDLLARRLVREGRYVEALPYFHRPGDDLFTDAAVGQHVRDYAEALQDAHSAWQSIDRAQAWYRAALLARRWGMDMMGYEASPDYFALDGDFGGGIGQDRLDPLVIADAEHRRFDESAAAPLRRFHYRYIAVDEAVHAADLLPPRSEAFAAVLCRATGWMIGTAGHRDTDDWISGHVVEANDPGQPAARAAQLYARYRREGAYIPTLKAFGYACPEPDFAGAAHLARVQPIHDARHFAARHRWVLGGGVLAILGGVGAGLFWRRRIALR